MRMRERASPRWTANEETKVNKFRAAADEPNAIRTIEHERDKD